MSALPDLISCQSCQPHPAMAELFDELHLAALPSAVGLAELYVRNQLVHWDMVGLADQAASTIRRAGFFPVQGGRVVWCEVVLTAPLPSGGNRQKHHYPELSQPVDPVHDVELLKRIRDRLKEL